LDPLVKNDRYYGLTPFVFALLGCVDNSTGLPVRFIVPDGFRGYIQLVETKDGPEIEPKEGDYIYRIPKGGVLKVKKIAGINRWHKDYANFFSGQQIPVRLTTNPEEFSGQIALYELSGRQFFVGTRDEMVAFARNPPPENQAAAFWSGAWQTNLPSNAGSKISTKPP
jgi:hypothetical protein